MKKRLSPYFIKNSQSGIDVMAEKVGGSEFLFKGHSRQYSKMLYEELIKKYQKIKLLNECKDEYLIELIETFSLALKTLEDMDLEELLADYKKRDF